jgi:hypothetical protein
MPSTPNGRPITSSPPPRGPTRSASGPAGDVATRLAGAVRRCVALMSALVALADLAGRRGSAAFRRLAAALPPAGRNVAGGVARAARGAARIVSTVLRRAGRAAVAAARRAAALAGVAAVVAGVILERAHAGLVRVKRSGRDRPHGPSASSTAGLCFLRHRRLVLPAVGAVVASALCGIALARAWEPKGGPSYITRSGLTVQLPPGWEQTTHDPGRAGLSSAIAAVPSEEPTSGFVAGKVGSQAAAARVLEAVQREGVGRTPVRLGRLYAWRYAGLRPRPHLVGTGYVVPSAGGAVLVTCHASRDDARVRLAECGRAASTLVVGGGRPRRLSYLDRSRQRLIRVIAALRSSRSEGRRRLATADLAPGQVRVATSLRRSYQRAARSLDHLPALQNGSSLQGLSTALDAAAAAYGRLAGAATRSSRYAYREASRAVAREEEAVRRELARAGGD